MANGTQGETNQANLHTQIKRKKRPLGIPTVRDRVMQTVVKIY